MPTLGWQRARGSRHIPKQSHHLPDIVFENTCTNFHGTPFEEAKVYLLREKITQLLNIHNTWH
jgi:hypothetical protein